MRELRIGHSRIELVQGDIIAQDTEAIVNAANASLLGGGGVDGAIHRAGGPAILAACRQLRGCNTGDAKITTAGRLRVKYVVHAVGPIYRDGTHGEAALLASAYERSVEVAAASGVRSLAFPSISTGAYGFPIEPAARIACRSVTQALSAHPQITLARFVLFSAGDLAYYEAALAETAAGLGAAEPPSR